MHKNPSECYNTSCAIKDLVKYRSRTDIISQILAAANGGATKTTIMYRGFLSFEQLKAYLAMLTENGLLEYDIELQKFRTSEKGLKFLQLHSQMGKFVIPNGEITQSKRVKQTRRHN